MEPAQEAGGRQGAQVGCAEERNRRVGVYFQKRRVEQEVSGKSLPEASRLEAILPHRGSLRHGQDLISSYRL